MGIGGAPGESVFVKAGIVAYEPKIIKDSNTSQFAVNVDKGNQSTGGSEAAVLGNVAKDNTTEDKSYQAKTFTHTMKVATDEKGELYIIIGTDSGFEGTSHFYYTNIQFEASTL